MTGPRTRPILGEHRHREVQKATPAATAQEDEKKKKKKKKKVDNGPSLFKPNKLPFDIAVINPSDTIRCEAEAEVGGGTIIPQTRSGGRRR